MSQNIYGTYSRLKQLKEQGQFETQQVIWLLFITQFYIALKYSRASHNAGFDYKKNQCASKIVYNMNYYIGTSKTLNL